MFRQHLPQGFLRNEHLDERRREHAEEDERERLQQDTDENGVHVQPLVGNYDTEVLEHLGVEKEQHNEHEKSQYSGYISYYGYHLSRHSLLFDRFGDGGAFICYTGARWSWDGIRLRVFQESPVHRLLL